MISQVGSAGVASAYSNNLKENKTTAQKSVSEVTKQGDMSKVDKIKESIESGEYKIDLQALSEKIADELL